MNEHRTYATPAAFRRALTDRLKDEALKSGRPLTQLQRQIGYDRLLARLYASDDRWIVKGAVALLARRIGVRATIDIDLYRPESASEAEDALRTAASADVGDWFRLTLGPSQETAGAADAVRIPVTAVLGTTPWARFHIDLVSASVRMTGQPDDVLPFPAGGVSDLPQSPYRVYPLVDHIADKIVAMYQRYGRTRRPSTRCRDLVDLVAIVGSASVDAAAQIVAVESESQRRNVLLPLKFDVPDRRLWVRGYAAEAARSSHMSASTIEDALRIASPFVDPVLDGTARGRWSPDTSRWISEG